jgi:hypothetical protein
MTTCLAHFVMEITQVRKSWATVVAILRWIPDQALALLVSCAYGFCVRYALCKNQGSLACGQENSILAVFLFLAPG